MSRQRLCPRSSAQDCLDKIGLKGLPGRSVRSCLVCAKWPTPRKFAEIGQALTAEGNSPWVEIRSAEADHAKRPPTSAEQLVTALLPHPSENPEAQKSDPDPGDDPRPAARITRNRRRAASHLHLHAAPVVPRVHVAPEDPDAIGEIPGLLRAVL